MVSLAITAGYAVRLERLKPAGTVFTRLITGTMISRRLSNRVLRLCDVSPAE